MPQAPNCSGGGLQVLNADKSTAWSAYRLATCPICQCEISVNPKGVLVSHAAVTPEQRRRQPPLAQWRSPRAHTPEASVVSDQRITVGTVVQIDPAHDDVFGACFLVVTEMKSFGVMGYVQVPGKDGGTAYYRVEFEYITYIGPAEWVLPTAEAESGS